jgi:hypothetical protein
MKRYILLALIFFCGVCLVKAQSFYTIRVTFEPGADSAENKILYPLAPVRQQDRLRANQGTSSAMLSNLLTEKIYSVPIPVKQGEQLKLQVFAHFEKQKDHKLLGEFAILVAAGVAAQSTKTIQKGEGIKTGLPPELLPALAAGAVSVPVIARKLRGKPDASLAWELYDDKRNLLKKGRLPVRKEARNGWQQLQEEVLVTQTGFLVIRLENESKNPVWFDDLLISSGLRVPENKVAQTTAPAAAKAFPGSTILAMTNSFEDGCGDDDEECDICDEFSECYDECECLGEGDCLPEVECELCDPSSGCYDPCNSSHPCYDACDEWGPCYNPYECEDDVCAEDPFSCECNPSYCDPCWTSPSSCDCPTYANNNLCECSQIGCDDDGGGGPTPDCAGVPGGSAYYDECGTCVGGTTGKSTQLFYFDSDGDGWGGSTTKNCHVSPGPGWVLQGGDHNDNCYNVANVATQCSATPCQNQTVNQMMSFQNASAALTSMRNSVQSGATHETGYPLYENATGGISFGAAQSGTANNPEVALNYNPGAGQSPAGFFHSHYQGTDYTFSPDDLYNYFAMSVTNNYEMSSDVLGVVNPNGTAYVVAIENSPALMSYLVQDWDNNPATPNTMVTLERFSADFGAGAMIGNAVYPGDPEKAAELKILSFLDGIGINLYRSSYDATNGYQNFSRLERAANGMSVQPCN